MNARSTAEAGARSTAVRVSELATDDRPDVGLVALDRKTGEERWVSEGVGFSHSTPGLLTLLGEPQLVVLTTEAQPTGDDQAAPMTIASIDPEDGSTNWKHSMTLTRLPIPRAVRIDDRRIFVTGGYRGGFPTPVRATARCGPLALSGTNLLMRSQEELVCVGL